MEQYLFVAVKGGAQLPVVVKGGAQLPVAVAYIQ